MHTDGQSANPRNEGAGPQILPGGSTVRHARRLSGVEGGAQTAGKAPSWTSSPLTPHSELEDVPRLRWRREGSCGRAAMMLGSPATARRRGLGQRALSSTGLSERGWRLWYSQVSRSRVPHAPLSSQQFTGVEGSVCLLGFDTVESTTGTVVLAAPSGVGRGRPLSR
jgi:hypothetical protein